MRSCKASSLAFAAVVALVSARPALAQETSVATGPPGLADVRALLANGKPADAEAKARVLLGEVEAEEGARSLAAGAVLNVLVESLFRGGKAGGGDARELA